MVTKVVVNDVVGALPPTGASARAPALVAPPPAVARASGRPSRARVQQIRELIFAAAMAEFSERGFRGATIASIAERSGVSRMTVYKHAESKEQLLEKLSEFSSERLRIFFVAVLVLLALEMLIKAFGIDLRAVLHG